MCTHRESVKNVVNEELIKIVCVFIQNKNGAYFILSQKQTKKKNWLEKRCFLFFCEYIASIAVNMNS